MLIITNKISYKKNGRIDAAVFFRNENDQAISSFAALLYSSISLFCISNRTGS